MSKGFTLVELMVSITIMVVILGVVLFNSRGFDSSIVLTNLAYDVGLSVREAQSYGISVKGYNPTPNTPFAYPYGIHFDSSNPTQYVIFVDLNGDGVYTGNETIKTYTIKGAYKISNLCTLSGTTCTNATVLDITFLRPNPDAIITANGISATKYDAAQISVSAARVPGSVKNITVRLTGQISIQ